MSVRVLSPRSGWRTDNGHTHETVGTLRFINRAKALGFSLEEIREILQVRRSGEMPCGCVATIIERNLAAIEQRIAELSALRRQLRVLAKRPAHKKPAETICPIIESDR